MIIMNNNQLFNNKSSDAPETQHEIAMPCNDKATGSMVPVNDDENGVFHYEQDHESLEDEVFELHTTNKNGGDNDEGRAPKSFGE